MHTFITKWQYMLNDIKRRVLYMKAIVIEQYGGAEELVEKELSKPVIQDNQVLIEMHATSINPIDWKVREGYLKEMIPLEFPLILGWDAAGVVSEVGKNVTNFNVGEEEFAHFTHNTCSIPPHNKWKFKRNH